MPEPLICPTCSGPKSKRAKLCRGCRQRANAIGERAWVENTVPPPPARLRTAEQSSRYHGKLTAIARAEAPPDLNKRIRQLKTETLAEASSLFGRTIESSTELTELEMQRILDRLDSRLDTLENTLALER